MMLYWEWGGAAYASSWMENPMGRVWENSVFLLLLLLLPGGRKFSTCFPAALSPCFPVIPAAPLTLILALELAAMLPFPGVAETRQSEG